MNKPMTTAEVNEFYKPLLNLFGQLKAIELEQKAVDLLVKKKDKGI